ncbi:MAG: PH domain-containing protein [Candidatus Pacebacteria bacterium]|nr:PH domain-containing protein [Candidatus Paceibacterota bacterium]MCF7862453.1 PH domain-containing protein [Candidatus Paceibacterota bacterium]
MKKLDPKAKIIFVKVQYFFLSFFAVFLLLMRIPSFIKYDFSTNYTFFSFLFSVGFSIWFVFFVSKLAFSRFSYGLGEKGLVIEKGVFFHTTKVIPYEKISNVTILSSRFYRLYTVRVSTMMVHPVLENTISMFTERYFENIKGVSKKEAEILQNELNKKIQTI